MVPLSESSPSISSSQHEADNLPFTRRDTIFNAVKGRLRQATPADNHACLLDACIEAMDQYA
jgi:hypothetical protein